jgi:acetolactate synthase-1/2/3 large subunit
MKKTGAQLAVFALEQLGINYIYGIPGTHTTEIYDALNESRQITPVLVTHEGCASFMGDATSRTTGGIGVLVIVPGAGLTHAMSGIAEAWLDGIPLLVISGGVRRDVEQAYQLHGIDQLELAKPVTKSCFQVTLQSEVIPTIYKAFDIAMSGEPGPVFIDIPIDVLMYTGIVKDMPAYIRRFSTPEPDSASVEKAADLIIASRFPMLYLGWGAIDAFHESIILAEMLAAPVATTLQGKSAFPNTHPLFTSTGIGKGAKPSGQWALKNHDLLLTVGARFGEVATASYSLDPPKNLIHADINPNVFNRNFKATLAIESDGKAFIRALHVELKKRGFSSRSRLNEITEQIRQLNNAYADQWIHKESSDRVQPGLFFRALQRRAAEDVIMVTDDGQHTFLTAELFPVNHPRHFISPTDFNCMGYCIPATIAAKLNNPGKQVISIVGDGALLMTGLELVTASAYDLPVLIFIFNDGELGQIAQFQEIPLNRKTCTILSEKIRFEGLAMMAGIIFLEIANDLELDARMDEAFGIYKSGRSVLVNVRIDYSQRTMLTKGAISSNLKRMPLEQKMRFIGRAIKRRLMG